MEFPNRNAQPPAAAPVAPGAVKRGRSSDKGKWGRVGVVAAVVALVILLIGIILVISTGNVKSQDKYISSSKLQAVFLNTGQVYFGNIKSLNSKYFVLTNVYYLQTSGNGSSTATANSNTNVALVKLGCELHRPDDQMVINSDQVTFWENLGAGGQVAQAVKTFEKQNPNGQKCSDQSSSASTTSGSSAQGAGSSTPAATTPKP